MSKFNHKSLGGFDVVVSTWVGDRKLGTRRQEIKTYRVMVTVDAAALAQMIGPKAVANKKGRTRLASGAIELVNLGGVTK